MTNTNIVLLSITLHTNIYGWRLDTNKLHDGGSSTNSIIKMVPVQGITKVATIGWREGTNIVIYDRTIMETWEIHGTNVTKGVKP
jgi:hypothetical protein